jgi:hypothetical protein
MFTKTGWIVLPLALAIRLPFLAVSLICKGLIKTLNLIQAGCKTTMAVLPKPQVQQEYIEQRRQAALARFRAND